MSNSSDKPLTLTTSARVIEQLEQAPASPLNGLPYADTKALAAALRHVASPRLAVILEGGLVNAVVTPPGEPAVHVLVVDYDTEDADPDDLAAVGQADGKTTSAYVHTLLSEPATIELDTLFADADAFS